MLLFLSADSPVPKGRKVVVMLTLRKLKEMIESPKKGAKKPTPKSLREGKAPVIAQKVIKSDTDLVTITVYKNGYVVYEAMSRVTVFPIEDISGYRYSSVAGSSYGCDLDESYFEEAEWYLRFLLHGEDRLSINLDSRNQKPVAFCLDPETGFSWIGEYDITADELLSGAGGNTGHQDRTGGTADT